MGILASVGKWFVNLLLLPLLKEGLVALANIVKDYFANKKLKETNVKKGEAYENAKDEQSAHDEFGNLP
jgi:hypothetical protein